MIKHTEITQGTEEWHAIKHAKIGGTRSSGLFIKSDNLLHELLSEIVEDFEMDFDSYSSPEMIRGVELEPYGRKKLIEYTGITFNEIGWLQCEESKYVGISPDGLSECEKYSCEIKCPGSKKHLQTILNDCIPSDHINQCLHYFIVNPNLEKHFFVSFRPENKYKDLFVKELTRDMPIDLGFTKKTFIKEDRGKGFKEYVETVPDIKTVDEWVKLAKVQVKEIENKIEDKLNLLAF